MSAINISVKPSATAKTVEFSMSPSLTIVDFRAEIKERLPEMAAVTYRVISKGKVLSDDVVVGAVATAGKLGILLMKTGTAVTGPDGGAAEDERVQCEGGCAFWGSKTTRNMCSKCYRSQLEKEEVEKETEKARVKVEDEKKEKARTAEVLEPEERQEDKTKCWMCEKKVGLLGMQCRCGYFYCTEHRYAEMHACEYDYKSNERRKLKKENPVVTGAKLNQ
jgi:hypothetical protein